MYIVLFCSYDMYIVYLHLRPPIIIGVVCCLFILIILLFYITEYYYFYYYYEDLFTVSKLLLLLLLPRRGGDLGVDDGFLYSPPAARWYPALQQISVFFKVQL